MLKFSQLEVEGFRSIVEPQVFNLDRPGLNMIKGTNGLGKTTLFEALAWCLYGANLKGTVNAKIPSWKEYRTKDWKGTHVAVYFTSGGDEYEIVRTIKYDTHGDVLIVTKNSEQIPELDKKDTQVFIDDLLTMDFKTFMSSFMFGQRMTRLVESPSADKRKLFEELFDMEWIQNMRDKAAEDLKEVEVEHVDLEHLDSMLGVNLAHLNTAVGTAEENLDYAKKEEGDQKRRDKEQIQVCQDIMDDTAEAIKRRTTELNALPPMISVRDNSGEIVGAEGAMYTLNEECNNKTITIRTLIGKLEAKKEALENFDESNYNHYLENVVRIDREMLDIVGKLYDQATSLLTMDEQTEILLEYEQALEEGNKIQAKQDAIVAGIRTLKEKTSCPACNRPFDNAAELKQHEDRLNKELEELPSNKARLDAARADAKLLEEYRSLYTSKKMIDNNAPDDPAVAKKAMKGNIDILRLDITQLEEDLNGMDTPMDTAKKVLSDLLDEKEKSRDTVTENTRIETEQSRIQGLIDYEKRGHTTAQGDIEKLKNRPPNKRIGELGEKLTKAQKECDDKVVAIKQSKENIAIVIKKLEVITFWLKDVFAANGLKAYIFKAMLDELNKYTAKYGTKLGCSIRFSLDLTKVSAPFNTICSLGDKVNKEYKEFSGGEKQRLDIVLMFAMHDLLSSTTGMNILIMDEVFEGLDEQGESDVFELIREKAENRSVYVISHSQVLDTLHSKTIEITKENGRTKIS